MSSRSPKSTLFIDKTVALGRDPCDIAPWLSRSLAHSVNLRHRKSVIKTIGHHAKTIPVLCFTVPSGALQVSTVQ
jgi:hypothetical protein